MNCHLHRRAVLAALVLLAGAGAVLACSVPVFRYALERWKPDPYGVVVFHKSGFSEADLALVRQLDPMQRPATATNQAPLNLLFRTVDLDQDPDPAMVNLWESSRTKTLPAMTVLYPVTAGLGTFAWKGALDATSVSRLQSSPMRADIVKRLAGGDSAVWVLLESGDTAKDDRVAAFLEKRLAYLESNLKLPELAQEDIDSGLVSVPEEALKIKFSLKRLKRDNEAESFFISMLLGSEPDLAELDEPMVFPIFGRGRVLYALVGEGINEETVDDAGAFLIGPCSCQVKDLNPGVDLLMGAAWDDLVFATAIPTREVPALSGFAGLRRDGDAGDEAVDEPGAAPPLPAVTNAAARPTPSTPAPDPFGGAQSLLRRILLVLGVLVLVGGGAVILIMRK